MQRPCIVTDCDRLTGIPGTARGLCRMHYHRWQRTGDPEGFRHALGPRRPSPSRVLGDMAERFWAKVDKSGECWEWRAFRAPQGYGMFKSKPGSSQRAHAVAWELTHGPLAPGMELDHLCRNRGCVNPAHLEPVTHRENTLRGQTVTAENAAKTHCPRGHEYTPENTIRFGPDKRWRWCRICNRETSRAIRAKRKAALSAN